MPDTTVMVEVGHGVLQRGLKSALLVLKETEDNTPHHCRKPGEDIKPWGWQVASLNSYLGEPHSDPRQEIKIDL